MNKMDRRSKYIKPIKIRSDQERHRQATWIELFIDLVFVLGISKIGIIFSEGFTYHSILGYSLLFLLFFWIWNRFTWYATMYDNDDIPYRISYLVFLFPVLGIANEIENITKNDFQNTTLYYLFINLILMYLWSRVIRKADQLNKNAWSFFIGYTISTTLLIISLFIKENYQIVLIILAFFAEFFGPVFGWYLSKNKIPIHSNHVVERHGLFTIILLGECLVALISNFDAILNSNLWYVLFFSFIIILSLWWLYFDCGYGYSTKLSKNITKVFVFGYGQFFVYITIAFSSVALEYALHNITSHHSVNDIMPGKILMSSIGLFLLALAIIQLLISMDKPLKIYLPRILCSIFLIIIAVFFVFDADTQYIVITSCFLVVLTINDVIQWAKYNALHKE